MSDLIQLRRDTAANWTSSDPILEQGEPGYELGTGFLKFGNGSTAWSSLPYFGATDLNGLTDVAIAAPTSGQVVRYNGSTWANAAISAGDLPSAIDATKIGAGSVDNTEFGYLNGVTSSIQTQINSKAASSHTHAASDIASGTIATARLGSGSASSSNWLRGDQSWTAPTASDVGAAASSHTHAASDVTSGQLALARGGAGADLSATGPGFLKQATSGAAVTVAQVTLSDLGAGALGAIALEFGSNATATASKREIFKTSGGLNYGVPTGDEHFFNVNNSAVMRISGSLVRFLAGTSRWTDGVDLAFGTTTGSKIGNGTTNKIGFWNATPVVQPAATGTSTTLAAAGSTNALFADSTSTGGTGSTAYSMPDIIKNLKAAGILAA